MAHYCFTLNNYNDLEIDEIRNNIFNYTYCIFGYEVAPTTGTPHLQGYMQFKCKKRLSTRKKYNPRISWRDCKGSDQQNYDYCTKEKKFEEFGKRMEIKMKEQGKRNDIIDLAEKIKNGTKTPDLLYEDPSGYHKYGRTMEKLEDVILRKKFRKEMTTCDWIFGKTGVGKSHKAFENYNPDTHYLWKLNDKGWQDGYQGQEIVIINDFRGEIPYNEMLNLIDKWPFTIPRRGREPVPFLAKKIIITSSLKPEEIYHRRMDEDSIEQLLRRINIIELKKV